MCLSSFVRAVFHVVSNPFFRMKGASGPAHCYEQAVGFLLQVHFSQRLVTVYSFVCRSFHFHPFAQGASLIVVREQVFISLFAVVDYFLQPFTTTQMGV